MQVMDNADRNFKAGGTSMLNQLAMVQPQGPLAYTTYDFLKAWSWILSFTKFLAHVFSLPLMVFLRRNFGMRYVDEVHLALSFVVWQIAGTFTTASGQGGLGFLIGGLINLTGFAFIPMAIWHRRRARQAAIRGEGYSYYPGLPWGFWVKVPGIAVACVFRPVDRVMRRISRNNPASRVPRVLTHPDIVLSIERIQGYVRRFGEPLLILLLGLVVAASGVNTGFGVFLIWTAMMLNINETLSQREAFEQFLDQVDARVLAREQERMLADPDGVSLTHGISMAR